MGRSSIAAVSLGQHHSLFLDRGRFVAGAASTALLSAATCRCHVITPWCHVITPSHVLRVSIMCPWHNLLNATLSIMRVIAWLAADFSC